MMTLQTEYEHQSLVKSNNDSSSTFPQNVNGGLGMTLALILSSAS